MQFINPLFLIGLGAALLPVVYHLIRRAQARKVPFSSVLFIKATPKQIVRKRRLRDILLMAMRAAMFALLALAFARPFLPDQQLPFVSGQQDRSVVLLVDASYSMQVGDLFERARDEVLRRIDEGTANDEYAVVTFSNQARPLTQLTQDRALLRGAVQSGLAVTNRPSDFYRPLQLAEEMLQEARHPNRSVILISDFQRSGWASLPEDWKLPPDVEFIPVKLSHGEIENAYLEAVEIRQQRSGNSVRVRYDARVVADTAPERAHTTISLAVDGRLVESREIEPLSSGRVTFQQQAGREGFIQGEITLPDDDLPIDNRYYFTYSVGEKPSILAIDGEASGPMRDVFFLTSAFDVGDAGRYEFSAAGPDRLTREGLRDHDLVFISNVPSLNRAQVTVLREYVSGGGGVVLSFGRRSDLSAYTAALREFGLGSISSTEPLRDLTSAPAIIGEVDLRHPVFNHFATSGTTVILRPRFHRYARIEPDPAALVLGRYDTGDPLLIERQLDRGRVLAYTATFNTDWTDFPLQEMYVPFLYQLAGHGVGRVADRRTYVVGDVVPFEGTPATTWEVRAPGDRLYRVSADEAGIGFFRETEVPGHYAVAGGGERFYFSVNLDPSGSNLETRDVEEAYAAVVDVAGMRDDPTRAAGTAAGRDVEREQSLWKYVILLVVALFALETFLANRSGRKSSRVAPGQRPVHPASRQPA